MPVTPTFPGVYIEELPSAVRTIVAVSTSVTAFVGSTARGPVNEPVILTRPADFDNFGRPTPTDVLGQAVRQFFLNGGSTAVVVRVAGAGATAASAQVPGAAGEVFTVTATEPGAFGDGLLLAVDYETPTPEKTFNLRVSDVSGAVTEIHRDLSLDPKHARYIEQAVNATSRVISVKVKSGVAADARPLASGTVSGEYNGDPEPLKDQPLIVTVDDGSGFEPIVVYDSARDAAPTNAAQLALLVQRKIRQAKPPAPPANGPAPALPEKAATADARVVAVGKRLQILAGVPGRKLSFGGAAAAPLGLANVTPQPAAYRLSGAVDGGSPGPAEFIGSADEKTGINALRDVSDVNLLCLPEVCDFAPNDMGAVLAEAGALCKEKRMLLIVDPPAAWTSREKAQGGLSDLDELRAADDYAAVYFPRIQVGDGSGGLRSYPPSGAVAGVMARTDAERGVWKAPAGIETSMAGVGALATPLNDAENGLLNPLGINCLRTFPLVGSVVWGARTLAGADALASQWKYVSVRRTALMIEESLYRGTKWVVFEPNDERLWGQIRLNVGAFMRTLFRQGAFQGASAREAYLVKCDKDTTTQDDINRGVVNILVGFAPLKPAEFVIVQIAQLAGQIEV